MEMKTKMKGNMNTMNIIDIESQLKEVISFDQKSWVKIYELMQTVEDNRLYEPDYKSYTAWVNSFADRAKVHVSLLWNRKKAGKFYSEYFERQIKNGNSCVLPLKSVATSPDNIILVEKIAGNNYSLADDLIEKVIKGDLKRRDLSNAWQTVKAERMKRGESVQRINAYDKPELSYKADTYAKNENKTEKKSQLTAMDIVLAFNKDYWITNRIFKEFVPEKYRIMTEFAVDTGITKHLRRMDILVLETLSTSDKEDIALHGIEIKVSKHDLLGNKKMAEYCYFCDYFWLAVPESLIECTISIIPDGWGVIAVSESKEKAEDKYSHSSFSLRVVVPAKHGEAVFRDKTIKKALLKLL